MWVKSCYINSQPWHGPVRQAHSYSSCECELPCVPHAYNSVLKWLRLYIYIYIYISKRDQLERSLFNSYYTEV